MRPHVHNALYNVYMRQRSPLIIIAGGAAPSNLLRCLSCAECRCEGWILCAVQVAEKGPVGLTQHPHRNLLATWSTEGALKLWKA